MSGGRDLQSLAMATTGSLVHGSKVFVESLDFVLFHESTTQTRLCLVFMGELPSELGSLAGFG